MVEQLTTLLLERRAEMSHPIPEEGVEFALIFLFATCKDKILLEEANHGTLATTDARLQIELSRLVRSYLGVRG